MVCFWDVLEAISVVYEVLSEIMAFVFVCYPLIYQVNVVGDDSNMCLERVVEFYRGIRHGHFHGHYHGVLWL